MSTRPHALLRLTEVRQSLTVKACIIGCSKLHVKSGAAGKLWVWSWVTVVHQEAELVALAILRIRDVAIAALDGARSVIQQQRGGFGRPSYFLILASIQRELRLLMAFLIPDSLVLTSLRLFARVR